MRQETIARGLDKKNYNLAKLIKVTNEIKLSGSQPTRLSNTYYITVLDPVSKQVDVFEQYSTLIKAQRKLERIADAIEYETE